MREQACRPRQIVRSFPVRAVSGFAPYHVHHTACISSDLRTEWGVLGAGSSLCVRFLAKKGSNEGAVYSRTGRKDIKNYKNRTSDRCFLRFVSYLWGNDSPETVRWLCGCVNCGDLWQQSTSSPSHWLTLIAGCSVGFHASAWASCVLYCQRFTTALTTV